MAPAEGEGEDEGEGDGEGVAVLPVGGVPVPVPGARSVPGAGSVAGAGSAAGRDSAPRTGASPSTASEAVPDVGVTGRTGAPDPDSGCGTARCTGAPVVVCGEPVRRSPVEVGRPGCAAARRGPGASVPAGGVVPPSVRRTARCTGGVEAVASLPAGADAGPSPGRTAGRRAGVADAGPSP
ncbi:hypothetical protein [Streptomyces sp. NPDC019793]|uniref:hypothetical protein n=1 Tax=Streptomyces sp. NPDC019793 TaxID=3154692 RepID=UPI0033E8E8AF